jgi:6-phosphogluconate dehydrogenase
MAKELGLIGTGRIGSGMARRLLAGDYRVVAHDRAASMLETLKTAGATCVASLNELVRALQQPRVIWLMLPAGETIDNVIDELLDRGVGHGDVVVDGGNSDFRDTIHRGARLAQHRVSYVDAGSSGGIHGAEAGYSLTVGGARDVYERIRPVLETLSGPGGHAYVGPSGSGHFAKMVHNAIEYGMMQALGEGFELLASGPYEELDLRELAHVWNQGSIIRSFLLELTERIFEKDPRLTGVAAYVEDTGEARWAIREALQAEVPFDTAAHALFQRFRSRQKESLSAMLIAALRHEFGGHDMSRRENAPAKKQGGVTDRDDI